MHNDDVFHYDVIHNDLTKLLCIKNCEQKPRYLHIKVKRCFV